MNILDAFRSEAKLSYFNKMARATLHITEESNYTF